MVLRPPPYSDSYVLLFATYLNAYTSPPPPRSRSINCVFTHRNSAHVMARRVWKVRHTIHVIAVDMSRSHCKLFPDGYPNAASSSDDDDDDGGFSLGPCLTADGFLGSAPGRRRKQLPGQHEIGKDCRPRSSDGPAAVGCCFKNPFCPPDMLVAEMARAKGGTCEWKESFEGAVANCQVRVVAVASCLSFCRLCTW